MALRLATILLTIVSYLTPYAFVAAIPSFEGIASWSSIGDLVSGMSFLEGLGPESAQPGTTNNIPYYVSIAATRGYPGNATMLRNRHPPLFYIHQNQLWHYHNESAIMPVNVHNSTGSAQLPLQMIVGMKKEGIPGGRWRWQGTMLFYENGQQHNQGLFYSCLDFNRLYGVFLFLESSAPPQGCMPFTIHSWNKQT